MAILSSIWYLRNLDWLWTTPFYHSCSSGPGAKFEAIEPISGYSNDKAESCWRNWENFSASSTAASTGKVWVKVACPGSCDAKAACGKICKKHGYDGSTAFSLPDPNGGKYCCCMSLKEKPKSAVKPEESLGPGAKFKAKEPISGFSDDKAESCWRKWEKFSASSTAASTGKVWVKVACPGSCDAKAACGKICKKHGYDGSTAFSLPDPNGGKYCCCMSLKEKP